MLLLARTTDKETARKTEGLSVFIVDVKSRGQWTGDPSYRGNDLP